MSGKTSGERTILDHVDLAVLRSRTECRHPVSLPFGGNGPHVSLRAAQIRRKPISLVEQTADNRARRCCRRPQALKGFLKMAVLAGSNRLGLVKAVCNHLVCYELKKAFSELALRL